MTDISQRIMRLFEKHPHYFVGDISNTVALTSEQLERHKDRLFWSSIEPYHVFGGLSWNRNLNWSKELLDQFKDRWDWKFLSGHALGVFIWYDGILEDYKDTLDWTLVSSNTGIPWSPELVNHHKDRLDWGWLSGNQSAMWTKDLILQYAEKLDFMRLSNNFNSPLYRSNFKTERITNETNVYDNIELVEQFEDRWNWDNLNWSWRSGLNPNETGELIETMLSSAPLVRDIPREEVQNDF